MDAFEIESQVSNSKSELKNKALNGMFWSLIERFGSLIILFSANIVLARLLSPDDYGLIGMIMVFITISGILVDGGLGSALIQKKIPTQEDYSTIFYVNIGVSIVCYLLLYAFSGIIADFFNQPLLVKILRYVGVIVIIDSLSTVQNNILVKTLEFRKIAIIKVSVATIASSFAIVCAFSGLGVWSLVVQYISNSLFKSLFLWISTKWHPSFVFSWSSFKSLFKFGSYLLIAGLLSELYRNLQVLIIGKLFPPKEVGYFSQAKQLENVPTSAIITIVNQVTYPVFSQIQDKKEELISSIRRCIKTLTVINFPIMALLAVIAKPLFVFLYSEKWLPAVPYFQWLCVGFGLLLVVHNTNLNALKAVGKSSIVLYLEIIKKIIGILLIFIFVKYGVIGILWALAVNSLIEFFLNGYCTGKYVGYGIKQQFIDFFPSLLITLFSSSIAVIIGVFITFAPFILLLIQTFVFASTYFVLMKIFKVEAFGYLEVEIKNKIFGRK